ncbi:MAG: ISKra4 family transposase [Mycobacterium sp.]
MTGGTGQAAVFGATSRACFEQVLAWLEGNASATLSHGELEDELECRGRELLRRLLQDHLTLRAATEEPLALVTDDAGVVHTRVEAGHRRVLASVFGQVNVQRLAYRHRGHRNLHPADGLLNLPVERHSHGLRRLAAIEASRGSFEQAAAAITRATGQQVGKRQVEALTTRAAADVEDFYTTKTPTEPAESDVLVISADGKGIVMRPEALRAATAKAAAAATTKLATRLSKGEKRNRKRMAEVGAVYDLTPVPRCPADVLTSDKHDQDLPPAPKAKNKWVTASVVDDAAAVIAAIFDQAERRDPDHARTWVALVDGNNHQIERIHAEADTRDVAVTILIDLVHVLEYLWDAAWCFFPEGDSDAEAWVRQRALAILDGHARKVAAGIRRRATASKLPPPKRRKADACATYLVNKAGYLDYSRALTAGWPIATGIIEGACRYLVADRMDLTGARWSVDGAEAVLKLRAVRANNDFDTYWRFHLDRERRRVHKSCYANDVIPRAA